MLREVLRPLVARVRSAKAWLRDVGTNGVAGASAYWSDPSGSEWKLNSHWRDASATGWSETWEEIGAAHVAMYKRFARSYELNPPHRTLEWGVGGGANAVHFARLSGEFIAVDISQQSLDETVRQVEKEVATPVIPIRVSLDDQAGGVARFAESIDLFICFYVLELVPSEALAHEIVRIAFQALRPGGTAIFQAKYKSSAPHSGPWSTYSSKLANSYVVDVPEFWGFLASVGFDVHQVELVPINQLDRNYAYFFVSRPKALDKRVISVLPPGGGPGVPGTSTPSNRERRFRLCFFGAFGCGNFGNDATLEACMSGVHMRVPKSEIVCVAADPAKVTASYAIESFPMAVSMSRGGSRGRTLRLVFWGSAQLRGLFRAWRLLRGVQTFGVAGTGVLDDQHVRPSQLPLDVFRWSLAARLAGARLIFLSVGAGPIDHPWSRVLLTRAVRFAHEVSYRDQRSLDYMRTLGRDVRSDRVLPDLALAAIPPDTSRRDQEAVVRRIAIGLLWQMHWHGRRDDYRQYEDRVVDLVVRLASDGWEVCLINGDEVDADTQLAILRRPELTGLDVSTRETHSFDDVVKVASQCAVLVGSRYHNIVAAVIAGIPAISLGYGPKNLSLLEQLGVSQWSHDIDEFSVDEVLRQVSDAARNSLLLYRLELRHYRDVLEREFAALAYE